MPPFHVLYKEGQTRIMGLVNNANAELPVPACPGWTVHDTVAHMLGTFVDFAAGKIGDATGPAWGDGHGVRAQGRSISDITSEWHVRATTTPGLFESLGAVLVADLVTHEFDIKGAIGNTQGRDMPVVKTVALFFLEAIDAEWRKSGDVQPLRIITESSQLDIGGDDPKATVHVSWWELGRVVTGRRSIDQVRALDWSTDPEPWLDNLFVFGPRDTDLVE